MDIGLEFSASGIYSVQFTIIHCTVFGDSLPSCQSDRISDTVRMSTRSNRTVNRVKERSGKGPVCSDDVGIRCTVLHCPHVV